MNPPADPARACRHCGGSLDDPLLGGVCARCLARFSLDADHGPDITGETELPAAPGALRVGTAFGDYELIEEIAHGGMGVVFKARQRSLDRMVAVKMLLFGGFAERAAFQRFKAEAQNAARLQHPNIVAIHEIGEQDGQPFYSMDYVWGRNLAEVDRPLDARRAAGYLRDIARAVQYAHDQGLLHRDLKPANILIDENDRPRITDPRRGDPSAGPQAARLNRFPSLPVSLDSTLGWRQFVPVRIIAEGAVRQWAADHARAAVSLRQWVNVVRAARWASFIELRRTFPTADLVRVGSGRQVIVFNVGGHGFRLICAVHFNSGMVFALRFLSHAEYSKDSWKSSL